MEIKIDYARNLKGELKINPDIPYGTSVAELVTVLESLSLGLKELTGKYLTDNHPGLNENEKFELSQTLKIEDLA